MSDDLQRGKKRELKWEEDERRQVVLRQEMGTHERSGKEKKNIYIVPHPDTHTHTQLEVG